MQHYTFIVTAEVEAFGEETFRVEIEAETEDECLQKVIQALTGQTKIVNITLEEVSP